MDSSSYFPTIITDSGGLTNNSENEGDFDPSQYASVGYSPSSNKYFVLEEDVEKDVKEEVKPSDSIKDFTLRKPSSSKDFEKRVENFWINSSKDIKKEFGSLKKFKIYADDLLLKVFADKYEEVSKLTEKDLKIAESIGIKNLKNINLEDIRY